MVPCHLPTCRLRIATSARCRCRYRRPFNRHRFRHRGGRPCRCRACRPRRRKGDRCRLHGQFRLYGIGMPT